jgi:tetratricopeptide (TPR) repeat protein
VRAAISRCEELSESVHGDVEVRAGIASTLAALHARLGQFDEARTLAEEARAIYEELGLRYMLAGEHAFASGSIELLAGDPAAAVRELRWGYDALEQMGERGTRSTLAAFLAEALVEQGRYQEAIAFSEISEQTGAAADVVTQAVWRSARAAALAQTGDPATAELLAEEAVSLAEATDFLDLQGNTLLGLAQVLRLGEESEAPPQLIERARQAFERKGNVVAEAKAAAALATHVR